MNTAFEEYVKRNLERIRRILNLQQDLGLSIDELVVLNGNYHMVYSCLNNRFIEEWHLSALLESMQKEIDETGTEPTIITLDGQEAELFDLLVPVTILNDEFEVCGHFYVFGNYSNGTLADLKTSPNWISAQNQFFVFTESLCNKLYIGHKTTGCKMMVCPFVLYTP